VKAEGCKACAVYALGLPEKPMKHLVLRDCEFTFDPKAEPLLPAMALQVEPCCRRGVIAAYLEKLTLDHVTMEGVEGPRTELTEVGEVADL
jgi:hypothetical protein